MAKKTLLDNIIESIKGIDGQLIKQSGTTKQMISDLNYKVVAPAKSAANSAVAYANDAVENSKVNSQAIDDINSAVSDAVSDAAVARSDGLRAWNAAQSNVNLIDLNYASASAVISSARTEALAAADEAKSSASAAQADIAVVKSSVATVQADVTATRSDVAVAKSDIADTKTTLAQTTSDLNSKISGVETSLADTTSALSDAKAAFNSDVAEAKNLANTAQSTADNAVKSASSVANDLTAVASQAKSNADGITKVTSDVGLLQTTVADNSGNISTIQETAQQIQQAVSDNAGNITVAKQTADSAVAVASDAKSNATVAIQTASQASITASNASGQAASAVITANGAMTTASNANSYATVAVQTASGASLTATNANNDATVAKQTASEAKVQASNAESDYAQLSIRAGQIEASVANNSGAIASVQQTANGLTTTVANITSNGGGRNLAKGTSSEDQSAGDASQITGWNIITIATYDNPQAGQQYTISVNTKNNGGTWAISIWDGTSPTQRAKWITSTPTQKQKSSFTFTWPSGSNQYLIVQLTNGNNGGQIVWNSTMLEKGTVAHDWSPAPEDLQNQFTQIKQSIDGVTTTINDPKTGLNATYQTAAGNATTISNINGDVSQLKVSASSASVALSDAAGNISSLQATASELETKYADAAGDISTLQANAKGMTQTISDAQGDIAKLKTRADGFDAEFATANGNISKLQTDASGTTQTLANTKSDVAFLQSRADGLDAKYADAAGDINTLKADASGFSQTLVSAKGDISTLQETATGFKNTLTDAQGDISTLQSDVSGLKKTTSDNAGNISTLQATAKTLTSQMADAQGNISTLKQTASGFSSKVSGMETSLSDTSSKINAIQANGGGRNLAKGTSPKDQSFGDASQTTGWNVITIATFDNPQAGQQYTISVNTKNNGGTWAISIWDGTSPTQRAKWITSTPTQKQKSSFTFTWPSGSNQYLIVQLTNGNNGGQIVWNSAMLEEGIIAHDWSPAPEDTDAKITANSTAIEQNRKAITLKADQTTVDKTNGTVQQLQSQLKVQAGQISSKVSSSNLDAKGYATQAYTQTQIKQTADTWNANLTSVKDGLTKSYTNLHATVDGIQAQVYNKDGSSKITQLSNVVQSKVSQGDYNSQITQLQSDINLRVKSADLISQINLQAGTALIQSNKLVLDGKTTIITGEAFIPSAAIGSIQADKVQIGNSQLFSDDGTFNLVNNNVGTASIKLTTGNVQGSTQPVTKFANGYNTSAIDISPVGTVVRPTLFFEDYPGQAKDTGYLGFSRHDTAELYFHTYDDTKELFRIACVSRFNQEIHVDKPIWQQGLSIASGNTIWSGSNFLAIGDHISNSFTDVKAKSFSQQSTLSSKTNIEMVDPKDALDLVNRTDIRSYQYKADVEQGKTKRYTSLIIDDVNDVSQYYAPNEFTNEERTGRDDGSAVGFLFLAVKELTRRIKTLEDKLNG